MLQRAQHNVHRLPFNTLLNSVHTYVRSVRSADKGALPSKNVTAWKDHSGGRIAIERVSSRDILALFITFIHIYIYIYIYIFTTESACTLTRFFAATQYA